MTTQIYMHLCHFCVAQNIKYLKIYILHVCGIHHWQYADFFETQNMILFFNKTGSLVRMFTKSPLQYPTQGDLVD